MIGAVAGQDLVPPGVGARQLDGILIGIRAAQGEEELVDDSPGVISASSLPSMARGLVAMRRPGIGQLARLFDDGFDHTLRRRDRY